MGPLGLNTKEQYFVSQKLWIKSTFKLDSLTYAKIQNISMTSSPENPQENEQTKIQMETIS